MECYLSCSCSAERIRGYLLDFFLMTHAQGLGYASTSVLDTSAHLAREFVLNFRSRRFTMIFREAHGVDNLRIASAY